MADVARLLTNEEHAGIDEAIRILQTTSDVSGYSPEKVVAVIHAKIKREYDKKKEKQYLHTDRKTTTPDILVDNYILTNAFVKAMKKSHQQAARLLLNAGADVNSGVISPLASAFIDRRIKDIEFLLQNGSDANEIDGYGRPLIYSFRSPITADDLKILRIFLTHGATLNPRIEWIWNYPTSLVEKPFVPYAERHQIPGYNLYPDSYMPPTKSTLEDPIKPLSLAVEAGDIELVQRLLKMGASPRGTVHRMISTGNREGIIETSYIQRMFELGYTQIALLLYDSGAVTSNKDKRAVLGDALWYSIGRGDVTEVKTLLDKGADITFSNPRGELPIDYAISLGRSEIIKLLHERGASVRESPAFANLLRERAIHAENAAKLDKIIGNIERSTSLPAKRVKC